MAQRYLQIVQIPRKSGTYILQKNDHSAQNSDIEILVPLFSVPLTALYVMAKSELQSHIPFSSNTCPGTGTREMIFSRNSER